MNYSRIYADFIFDRRVRECSVNRGERHHIVPRSIGGTNECGNIILLSHDDHLFAHILLAKIHGGKMTIAANMMLKRVGIYRGRAARARFAWIAAAHARTMANLQSERMKDPSIRARTSAALKGRPKSREALAKRSETRKGWVHPPESKAKMAAARVGRTLSETHAANISKANKGKPVSAEHREKISKRLMGHVVTESTRQKLSLAAKGRKPSDEARAKMSAARIAYLQRERG